MKIFWGFVGIFLIVGLGYLSLQTIISNASKPGVDKSTAPSFTAGPVVSLHTPVIEHLAPHLHEPHDTVHDDGHHVTVRSNILLAPEDMWLTGFRFTIDNAPNSTLHHAQLADLDALSNTCAMTNQPKELLTIGEDSLGENSFMFKDGQGIFIPAGHRLELLAMFHNPEPPIGIGGDYHDVSAQLELAYEPASKSTRSVALEHYHLHLDDEACADMYTFAVPPQTTDFRRSPTGTPKTNPAIVQFDRAGEIVYSGGHLHGWEGGKYLELLVNGEAVRRFETEKSTKAGMQWETPHGPDSITIEAGDMVTVSAVYDNPLDEPIVGAMGIVNFYFAPETQSDTAE